MAYARIGLKRLAAWNLGTAGAKDNLVIFDLRKPAKLEISEEGIQDYRKRTLPTYTNMKVSVDTFNVGRPLLVTLLNQSTDADLVSLEAVSEKNGGQYDGIYLFDATGQKLGIDFDYLVSATERSANITYEAKFEKSVANAILLAATTNVTPIDFTLAEGGSTVASFNTSQYRTPYLSFIKYTPSGGSETVLVAPEDVISYKLSLKTTGRKTLHNRTVVDYITATLEVEIASADKTTIKNLHLLTTTDFAPEVKLQMKDSDSTYENHNFADGVLTSKFEATVGDDARSIKMVFSGDIPLGNISYTTETNTYAYAL